MKAIILAAGKGRRLEPLTNTIPKSLIEICGKSILEYNLESIFEYVDEIFIVVGYLKEKIINKIKDSYKGVKITYITQNKNENGTGAAIKNILFDDEMIILYGDSILDKKDIKKVIKNKHYGALVKEVENPKKYGIYSQDKFGFAIEIVEKPEENIGNLANLGCYKLSKEIFDHVQKIKTSKRGEYEITDAINMFIKNNKFELINIKGDFIDITYAWDILSANKLVFEKEYTGKNKGIIEDGVYIKGKVILEKGAIIKSGTYIEGDVYIGKNSVLGPNANIRGNVVIGKNCIIGLVDFNNVSIGNDVKCKHNSYIGYSILGNNINIGAGFICASMRHDKNNVKVLINGELIDTGKKKFGVIIGDNVNTGINTSTMPGRIIKNDSFTQPSEIIK